MWETESEWRFRRHLHDLHHKSFVKWTLEFPVHLLVLLVFLEALFALGGIVYQQESPTFHWWVITSSGLFSKQTNKKRDENSQMKWNRWPFSPLFFFCFFFVFCFCFYHKPSLIKVENSAKIFSYSKPPWIAVSSGTKLNLIKEKQHWNDP